MNGFLKFILILLGQKPDGVSYDPIKLDADGNIKVTTGLSQPTTPTDTQPVSETNSAAIKTAVEALDDIVKSEGEAHTSGEKGVLALAVRNDAGLPLALDGQTTPISTNENGEVLADARQGPAAAIAGAWPVKVTDGVETLEITAAGAAKVDGSGVTQPISAASLPLPAGAATASAQATQQTSLNAIRDRADFPLPAAQVSTLTPQTNALTDAQLRATPVPVSTGLVQPTTPIDTQPISAATLPLPSGAATAALQGAVFDLDSGAGTQNVAGVSLRKTASGGSVELGTATDPVRTDPTGATVQPVSATALPLPAGAATAALQGTVFDLDTGAGEQPVVGISLRKSAAGGSVELGTQADPVRFDPIGVTVQPISAASLPLPTGAATAANQQTDALTNAQLRAFPVPTAANQGDPNAGGAAAWFLQSEDGKIASLGHTTDLEATGNGTLIAILKRMRTLFSGGLPSALSSDRLKVENQHAQPLTDAQMRATPVPVKDTSTGAKGVASPADVIQSGGADLSGLLRSFAVDDKGVQYFTPAEARQIALGRFFIGGGKVTVTANTAVVQLENPSASGRTIVVSQFFLAADTAIDAQFVVNATVNTPTVRSSNNLNLSSAEVAVGVIRTGATGVTGGTNFSSISRLAANATSARTIPIILPPGTSVAATFAAGGLTSVGCYASVAWSEVNL